MEEELKEIIRKTIDTADVVFPELVGRARIIGIINTTFGAISLALLPLMIRYCMKNFERGRKNNWQDNDSVLLIGVPGLLCIALFIFMGCGLFMGIPAMLYPAAAAFKELVGK